MILKMKPMNLLILIMAHFPPASAGMQPVKISKNA